MSAFKSNKRKLSGNQQESPDTKNFKPDKNFASPKQNKNTPKAQKTPLQQTTLKQEKTPRQHPLSAKSTGKKTPKQPDALFNKLQMFKGTAKLNSNNPNQVQKLESAEKPSQNIPNGASAEPIMNRHKRRRAAAKEKLKVQRDLFQDLKEKASKGDAAARKELENKVADIERQGAPSNTKRRTLDALKSILGLPRTNIAALSSNIKQETTATNVKIEGRKRNLKIKPVVAIIKQESTAKKNKQQNGRPSIVGKPDKDMEDNHESCNEEEEEDDSSENHNEEEGSAKEDEESEEEEDSNDDDKDQPNEVTPPTKLSNHQQQANHKNKPTKPEVPSKSPGGPPARKSRYVVFAGNLAYTSTADDLKEHFKNVGEIADVRIPLNQDKKPRGFAYVELKNQESYQKALSLDKTFLGGRRINVLYSEGGKKKTDDQKSQMKAKNLKLQAMRKKGQLLGSVRHDKKRSVRRAKNNKKGT